MFNRNNALRYEDVKWPFAPIMTVGNKTAAHVRDTNFTRNLDI